MRKRLSRLWTRYLSPVLRRFVRGELVHRLFRGLLRAVPVLWLAALVLPPLLGYLKADSAFILSLLSALAAGASAAVVNLGELKKSWTHWIQGAAAVTVLPVMFAACKVLGELDHAEELPVLVNRVGNRLHLSDFNTQWSLFLLFTLLFSLALGWISLYSRWLVSQPDLELDAFRDALRARMEKLGKALDWGVSAADASGRTGRRFTPLEAQVEQRGKRTKRYDDLLSCMRDRRNRRGGNVFLLKGDPGSGKSVALRKLSVDLLGEDGKTLPVYLNLKEWKYGWDKRWTREEKQEKFRAFALDTLSRDLEGKAARDFLNDRLPALLDAGKVYFLLDSFDELPCLLGQEADRELIPDISAALHQFLTDTGAGGVVASREYHGPARDVNAEITLYIQEFDESRIRGMLRQYLPGTERAVWNGLKEREDLLSLCRNPFHLTLLINYIHASGVSLPNNQMELYKGFLNQQLRAVLPHGAGEETARKLTDKAKELAVSLQNRNQYECSLSDLYPLRCGWKEALELLEKIRVCRFGSGARGKTVTFIHRRFQEYFLVLHMQENRVADDAEMRESITGYTKNRDACVLYCGVAEEEDAKKIAAFCWETIKADLSQGRKWGGAVTERLVNTLLFLADAFRNRQEIIEPFREELERLISEALEKEKELIIQYALVNATVLFSQEALQKSVLLVFKEQNRLLENVVMKNFRLLVNLKPEVKSAFCRYFQSLKLSVFLRRFWSTRFALSISKHFRFVRFYHTMLLAQFFCSTVRGRFPSL